MTPNAPALEAAAIAGWDAWQQTKARPQPWSEAKPGSQDVFRRDARVMVGAYLAAVEGVGQ